MKEKVESAFEKQASRMYVHLFQRFSTRKYEEKTTRENNGISGSSFTIEPVDSLTYSLTS